MADTFHAVWGLYWYKFSFFWQGPPQDPPIDWARSPVTKLLRNNFQVRLWNPEEQVEADRRRGTMPVPESNPQDAMQIGMCIYWWTSLSFTRTNSRVDFNMFPRMTKKAGTSWYFMVLQLVRVEPCRLCSSGKPIWFSQNFSHGETVLAGRESARLASIES